MNYTCGLECSCRRWERWRGRERKRWRGRERGRGREGERWSAVVRLILESGIRLTVAPACQSIDYKTYRRQGVLYASIYGSCSVSLCAAILQFVETQERVDRMCEPIKSLFYVWCQPLQTRTFFYLTFLIWMFNTAEKTQRRSGAKSFVLYETLQW